MQLGIQRQMTFWLLEKVERVLPNVVQKVNREKKGENIKEEGTLLVLIISRRTQPLDPDPTDGHHLQSHTSIVIWFGVSCAGGSWVRKDG